MTREEINQAQKNWCLGLVSNPYATVCLIELGDDGKPAWRKIKAWTGKWNAKGEPTYRGTRKVVDTYNVHQSGGMWPAENIRVVDATPRTFADACAIASQCEAGTMAHIRGILSPAEAKAMIDRAMESAGA